MTEFLKPFLTLRSNIKLRETKDIIIDNLIFRLHYRYTAILLFVCTVLVTSRQYIGEHIKCIVGNGLNAKVVSSYCFFMSTFTVFKHLDPQLVKNGTLPHLGVGPYTVGSTEEVVYHAYYQWVPFMLFGQAIMFILTHIMWKKWEGGKLKALLVGVENASFAFAEKELKAGKVTIPSIEKKRQGVALIRNQFLKNNYITNFWPIYLITCETLNVLHIILQMCITDKFLGGIFWSLGFDLMDRSQSSEDLLDTNFPKVTKCSFEKYGPSGSIQVHDVLCVMALNVMNEKIYSFLWFWFIFLFFLSLFNVVWRLLTIFLHNRSPRFNRYVFTTASPGRLNALTDVIVTDKLPFKDWLFLKYLGKNVEGLLFKEIINELTNSIHEKVSMEDADELYKLHQ
ncbi:hypothetical protein HHI36_021100 [Cryptolaemus montrouzieri]|uniref:Innexin n=1 Tax=Cryptolaemus montrouzieri TaxID=559131 RepID=A0ABD2MVT0_9CUCU